MSRLSCYRYVRKYLEEQGLAFSQMMELWSIEAIKRCVRSGLGITCLPLMTEFIAITFQHAKSGHR
ncbi:MULTISPECIES: LysR substrate-binding domain-containing protein [Brevibacillus]|uniref:LysR substrate-binding domain-containing protein n=1 Tax=Brevibacillus TaxID=55080 RepID=UPI0037C66E96